jgi:hypothetical protein
MPEALPYVAYAVLYAGLLVWANARAGAAELWRVTLVLCVITGAHAGLTWVVQVWLLPELVPGESPCRLVSDPRFVPVAIMSSSVAVAACDALGVRRSLQVLVAAAIGWLVLLSRAGLYMSATAQGAA